MLKNLMMGTAALALSVSAMAGAANATIFTFHAHLDSANNIPDNGPAAATGTGTMFYDDNDTIGNYTDDLFRQILAWSGLPNGNEISQGHNHLGARGTNGPIIQDFEPADTILPSNHSPNDTGFIPVLGNLLAPLAGVGPLPLSALDEQGTPAVFGPVWVYDLDDLAINLLAYAYGTNDDGRLPNAHGHLDTNWYVNLHSTPDCNGSTALGTGCIRDQWQFGADVPEPASLTLLGAGLMGLGYFGKRRTRSANA